MDNMIHVTEQAACYLKEAIAKAHALGFRLSIKQTGCSGYAYETSLVQEKQETDVCFQLANGIEIFLNPEWISIFTGLTIDFIEENKSGLKQKRLVFINPKESGRCGCGESFHLDT